MFDWRQSSSGGRATPRRPAQPPRAVADSDHLWAEAAGEAPHKAVRSLPPTGPGPARALPRPDGESGRSERPGDSRPVARGPPPAVPPSGSVATGRIAAARRNRNASSCVTCA
jgi:hypothetical protein